MSERPVVRLENEDGIYTITFNRPEKRNAMSPALHREMHRILTELRFDPKVRVLIVTGEGESFCAGQDLKEYFFELDADSARLERERIRAIATEWRSHLLRLFHAPTIAAVNGWCFGGAFSIVAACDIAIAAEDAIFGLSEINFKQFPGGLVTHDITKLLRPRDALYYAMMGEKFDGKRAAEIGLVTKAVPKSELASEVRRIAETLRAKDPQALRSAKEVFKIGGQMNVEEAYAFSAAKGDQMSLLQGKAWVEQGIGDFMAGKYRPGLETSQS
jgi:trans-feruloyl-CoA hydratase/vanillin synthase